MPLLAPVMTIRLFVIRMLGFLTKCARARDLKGSVAGPSEWLSRPDFRSIDSTMAPLKERAA
jgi:hypothetical protein